MATEAEKQEIADEIMRALGDLREEVDLPKAAFKAMIDDYIAGWEADESRRRSYIRTSIRNILVAYSIPKAKRIFDRVENRALRKILRGAD